MRGSRRMRLLFAVLGALACLGAALLAEFGFGAARTAERLDRANAPSLLFVDAFGRRLAREGGQTGDVRITLLWNNRNDLDLWCIDPDGEKIFYQHPRARSGGELDVDMNVGPTGLSDEPVENIFWPVGDAPRGRYQVLVDHYRNHGAPDPTPFEVEVYDHGAIRTFRGHVSHGQPAVAVTSFTTRTGHQSPIHVPHGFWHALAVAALWGAALALALFLVLSAGLWLHYGRPPLSGRWWLRRSAKAAGVGLASGLAGQGLFGLWLLLLPFVPPVVGRIAGWALLGWVMGYGLSALVPCMPRRLACWCGFLGGVLGYAGFNLALLDGSRTERVMAAVILGFAIGWAVSILRAETDEEAPQAAAATSVRVHAHRTGPSGVLRMRHGVALAVPHSHRRNGHGNRSEGRSGRPVPLSTLSPFRDE